MNLLVVDWDFFFRVAELTNDTFSGEWQFYDWGHSEDSPFYYEVLWPTRASSFLAHDIPLPMTTGEEKTFWSRFSFDRRGTLFYADSNAQAYNSRVYQSIWGDVWLYDAHHDSGYEKTKEEILERGKVTCEDWMIGYDVLGCDLHMRYPRWRSHGFEIEPEPAIPLERQVDDDTNTPVVTFQRVFVCRSSCWTPPWLDRAFMEFLDACPLKRHVCLDEQFKEQREWDEESARSDAVAMHQMQEELLRRRQA